MYLNFFDFRPLLPCPCSKSCQLSQSAQSLSSSNSIALVTKSILTKLKRIDLLRFRDFFSQHSYCSSEWLTTCTKQLHQMEQTFAPKGATLCTKRSKLLHQKDQVFAPKRANLCTKRSKLVLLLAPKSGQNLIY